jgi:hypothetical protein
MSAGGWRENAIGIKNVKIIKLTTPGKYAIVDDRDYIRVSHFKWRADLGKQNTWYALRRTRINGKESCMSMHRFILGETSYLIDHKNRNGLDNRRSNLRLCTYSQNSAHAVGKKPWKLKGISWHKGSRRWQAQICKDYHNIYIGKFLTAQEAADAYDKKARELFGEFSMTNKDIEKEKTNV